MVGDPYLDGICFASIEKYPVRPIAMDYITQVNTQLYTRKIFKE